MLTDADIDAILGDKPAKQSSKNRVFTDSEGWVTWKTTTKLVGAYEGKTGTKYRSRKGRTWMKPNGERYYIGGAGNEILAYKARGI